MDDTKITTHAAMWHDVADALEPWETEPRKLQWVDEATDLDCLIVRNHMGALCGYVGVPNGHPLYGSDYDDVEADVHGGLTYAAPCREDRPDGICHVPEPGRPADVWWLGFDCAHAFDLIPSMLKYGSHERDVYRDVPYVRAECARLAAQLAAS